MRTMCDHTTTVSTNLLHRYLPALYSYAAYLQVVLAGKAPYSEYTHFLNNEPKSQPQCCSARARRPSVVAMPQRLAWT